MGCGCGNKVSKSKEKTSKSASESPDNSAARKQRVNKLISIPGKVTTNKR